MAYVSLCQVRDVYRELNLLFMVWWMFLFFCLGGGLLHTLLVLWLGPWLVSYGLA